MDFFFKNLESAQAQAKLAALNAQKTAKGFAAQVSKQSKTLAEHVQVNTQLLAEQVNSDPCGLSSASAGQVWPLQDIFYRQYAMPGDSNYRGTCDCFGLPAGFKHVEGGCRVSSAQAQGS